MAAASGSIYQVQITPAKQGNASMARLLDILISRVLGIFTYILLVNGTAF